METVLIIKMIDTWIRHTSIQSWQGVQRGAYTVAHPQDVSLLQIDRLGIRPAEHEVISGR